MMGFDIKNDNSLSGAKKLDESDPLNTFRDKFHLPKNINNEDILYFAGHSLGLMPKKAQEYLLEETSAWAKYGVEGHFHAKRPWVSYHEELTPLMSKVVGGLESEVVVMNTLTVNLHLMMVSFYRPTKKRFKILIENNTFPSDKYAVDGQARFHGFDPKEAILELSPTENGLTVNPEKLLNIIEENKDSLALIMLGNVNYLSGQYFDCAKIVKKAHEYGIIVGFNFAHGAGNLMLKLHDWEVDFAVWCGYKYLNSGPGGLGGVFVHEKHHQNKDLPRFQGWWGHNKKRRFKMEKNFDPIEGAQGWQLSNPPIFPMATLLASLEIFEAATMGKINTKSSKITNYLQFLIEENCKENCEVITPKDSRGSMLCLRMKKDPKKLLEEFKNKGVILDFREPDILRVTPAPLYNSYVDVFKLVNIMKESLK